MSENVVTEDVPVTAASRAERRARRGDRAENRPSERPPGRNDRTAGGGRRSASEGENPKPQREPRAKGRRRPNAVPDDAAPGSDGDADRPAVSAITALECCRRQTLRIIAGSATWLGRILGGREAQMTVLKEALVRDRILVARQNGEITGVLGFAADGRGPFRIGARDVRRAHGSISGSFRFLLLKAVTSMVKAGPDEVFVEFFRTRQRRRQGGTGSSLLSAAEQRARLMGKRKVRLFVEVANENAFKFYRSRGYTTTRRLRLFGIGALVGHAHIAVMEKDVGPDASIPAAPASGDGRTPAANP
jgi:ribosomal protein S18 acetylase RimI-like enzyme